MTTIEERMFLNSIWNRLLDVQCKLNGKGEEDLAKEISYINRMIMDRQFAHFN